MKHSVQWHKDCLANARLTLQRERDNLERIKNSISRMEKDCNFRDAQIIEAEIRGVTEFDPDKFGIQKAVKPVSSPIDSTNK